MINLGRDGGMFDILGDLSVDQDIVSFVADGEFVLDFPHKNPHKNGIALSW